MILPYDKSLPTSEQLRVGDSFTLHGSGTWHLVTAEDVAETRAASMPPNAYEKDLATLRAAAATVSPFERQYRADRLAALKTTRDALDAEPPFVPRAAEAVGSEIPPAPDGYAKALAARRAAETPVGPAPSFEERYKAERLKALAEEYARYEESKR